MELTTPRLRLDRLRAAAAAALFAYRADPTMARFQGWRPGAIEDAARFIEQQRGIAFGAPGSWFQFALRRRDSGELAGDLGLHFVDEAAVELGIALAPAQQGREWAELRAPGADRG
ncbi:GNAT family N-acetyltransferase [Fulvimonas soli]|uniref:Acetyltransferase (GNAT) family protein n=1 Tax=Fulvimonas soli TaxID=155197 RepID=A0A316HYK8_9GAMM|nr:GNAT family N-acetyltransferase [Fulvimonas soli]PWK85250.1 acetyltransferase (GNAT) family protein [Fulvimonas soli]TNY25325.1 hypothetical protein BV497_14440 [Fulvimonas soli]